MGTVPTGEEIEFVEARLAVIPEAGVEAIGFTTDRHVFSIENVGDDVCVAWDGLPGRPFRLIPQADGNRVVYSPNQRHIAFYGERDGQPFVGVDSREEGPYDDITRSVPPSFSPDGNHLAYGAMEGSAVRLVVDGVHRPGTNLAAGPVAWSSDSRRLAWVEQEYQVTADDIKERGVSEPRQRVVIDGEASDWVDGIEDLPGPALFSPDSRHVAYAVREGMSHQYVIDGQRQQAFEMLDQPIWSPDSGRFAYGAVVGGDRMALVIDGAPGPPAWRVGAATFSADSRRVAYAASDARNRLRIVIDTESSPVYNDLWGSPAFSPDGRKVAYLAMRSGSGLLGRFRTSVIPVVDGVEQAVVDEVSSPPHFSPDGAHVAFSGRRDKDWHMFVDGVPGPSFKRVGPPLYAPNGQLRYLVESSDGSMTVVTDARPGPSAEAVEDIDDRWLAISPDGRHAAWVAAQDDGYHPVLDGWIGPAYLGCTVIEFLDNDTVCFGASRDGDVYWVTVNTH
jgi:hypothetical protein